MANLRRPKHSKDKDSMFNLNGCRCKKHPKHVQSPGVCSLCLKDKLDQLSTSFSSSSQKTTSSCSSSTSSLSSYYSSSSASSCSTPMHDGSFSTEGKTSSIFLFHKQGGLVKSKSMVVVPRRRKGDNESSDRHSKKSGFWFKLFHPNKSKKMMENKGIFKVVRTSSVRQTVTVAS